MVFEKLAPHKSRVPVVRCDGSVSVYSKAAVAEFIQNQTGKSVEELQSSAKPSARPLALAENATQAAASLSTVLEKYPLLFQKDPKNYCDQSLLQVYDTLPDKSRKELVPNLACAATIYTMLERGRGNQNAMIDDFYIDPRKHGGDGPGARRPEYVGADIEIDSNRILQSLQEKQPVILHGYGGPLLEHFVLVVGSQTDAAERRLVAFDPYPGSDRDEPGKQIEIKVANGVMSHPTLSSVVFRNMRMVKAPESKPVTDSPPTTTGTDSVTMKD